MNNDTAPEVPTPSTQATVDIPARVVDMEGLKALAHPLRVKILDVLSTYGEFTASGLGERLGESSGATSYHLRQLEKHNFVREVEGRGTGRERWWERVPGGIMVGNPHDDSTPSERAASKLVLSEWMVNRRIVLDDFLNNGDDVLSKDWMEASVVSMSNLNLTREQTVELSTRLQGVLDEFVVAYRGQKVPGARPVQTHINVFPVIDGTQIPENSEDDLTKEDPS